MKHKLNLTGEKVQALCIANNYCTAMDNANYSTMLHNVDRDNKRGFGPVRLARLAQLIKLHSDTSKSIAEIATELRQASAEAHNLRSNSRQARANLRRYICEHMEPDNYTGCDLEFTGPASFPNVAHWLYKVFSVEMPAANRPGCTTAQRFEDWCSGLPSALDTCFWYNRSAVDDLGSILQQTPEQKAKYTEGQAEKELTRLIFREIEKEVNKNA